MTAPPDILSQLPQVRPLPAGPLAGFGHCLDLSEANLQRVEDKWFDVEPPGCAVVHRFGPGVYIRELSVKAGTLLVGHFHRDAHLNILLQGSLTMLRADGTASYLKAPATFLGSPGRKVAIVHEDMIFSNVYATTETDVRTLEQTLLVKSAVWGKHLAAQVERAAADHQADREDYPKALAELGFTHEQARAISENTADQVASPLGNCKIVVSPSPIEGLGIFATCDIAAGEDIAVARLGAKRTPAGRYANHSATPTARVTCRGEDLIFVAVQNLKGCRGGLPGDEITVDYRQAHRKGQQLCQ